MPVEVSPWRLMLYIRHIPVCSGPDKIQFVHSVVQSAGEGG